MKRKPFTDEEKAQMKALRKEGLTYSAIANKYDCSPQAVCDVVLDRNHTKKPRSRRVTLKEEEIRMLELPLYDNRTLTARILGDPLPERSALARRAYQA